MSGSTGSVGRSRAEGEAGQAAPGLWARVKALMTTFPHSSTKAYCNTSPKPSAAKGLMLKYR